MVVGMLTCLYEIVRKQIRIWDWQTGKVVPVFNKIASRAESPGSRTSDWIGSLSSQG